MTDPVCQVHARHWPAPMVLHRHHVQPEKMGGPSTPDNMVTVCPTGHSNIHAVLAALVFKTEMPKATRTEKKYAAIGYERWIAACKPGSAQSAYGLPHTDR